MNAGRRLDTAKIQTPQRAPLLLLGLIVATILGLAWWGLSPLANTGSTHPGGKKTNI